MAAADSFNRLVGIGALLLFMTYSFLVNPDKLQILKCFFKGWTGLICPACGLTHSLYACAGLHWGLALRYHLFGPFLFVGAWALLTFWSWELVSGRRIIFPLSAIWIKRGLILWSAPGWFTGPHGFSSSQYDWVSKIELCAKYSEVFRGCLKRVIL